MSVVVDSWPVVTEFEKVAETSAPKPSPETPRDTVTDWETVVDIPAFFVTLTVTVLPGGIRWYDCPTGRQNSRRTSL